MVAIATYFNKPHNQIISGLEGTFDGSGKNPLPAPNPPPTGANKGWLVLVARALGAAAIDIGAEVHLGAGAWKLLLVNFGFYNLTNGLTAGLYLDGATDVHLWYPDMQNPVDTTITDGGYRPRLFYVSNGGKLNIYGGSLHRAGSTCILNGADTLYMEGVFINQIGPSDNRAPLPDRWHTNSVGTTNGYIKNLTAVHSELNQRMSIDDAGTGGDTLLTMDDCWVTAPDGVGMNLLDRAGANTPGIHGTLRNTYVFNTAGAPRADNPRTGNPDYTAPYNQSPTYINVTDDSTVKYGVAPPPGTFSPRNLWQTANPNTAWQTFPAFYYLPAAVTPGSTWKDRLGLSPGTVGNNWTTADFDNDVARLQNYGSWVRLDINWSVVYGSGWRPTNRSAGWAGYDALVAKFVGAGTKKFIMCIDFAPTAYATAPRTYPDRAKQTEWENFCVDVDLRYAPGGAGGVPASGDTWDEIWNEANNTGKNNAGNSDYIEYAWLYKAACDAIKAARPAAKVMPCGPAPSATNVNDLSSNFHGFVYNGALPIAYAPYDWYNNLLTDPAALLNTTTNPKIGTYGTGGVTTFDGLGFHPYSSSEGPFGTHGVAAANVNTQPGDYNAFRLIPSVWFLSVAAGNDAVKSKLNATECGYDTAPTYQTGVTYQVGDVVYGTAGNLNAAWSPGSLTQPRWTRGTRYKRTGVAGSNAPPGANWATHTDGDLTYDVIAGSSVFSEPEFAQAYRDITNMWFGAVKTQDGYNIADMVNILTFYQNRDLDQTGHAQIFNGHMGMIRKSDGQSKGGYEALVQLAANPISQRGTQGGKIPVGVTLTFTGTKAVKGACIIPVGTYVTAGSKPNRGQSSTTIIPVGVSITARGDVQEGQTHVEAPLFSIPTHQGIRTTGPKHAGIRQTIPRHRGVRGTIPHARGTTATET